MIRLSFFFVLLTFVRTSLAATALGGSAALSTEMASRDFGIKNEQDFFEIGASAALGASTGVTVGAELMRKSGVVAAGLGAGSRIVQRIVRPATNTRMTNVSQLGARHEQGITQAANANTTRVNQFDWITRNGQHLPTPANQTSLPRNHMRAAANLLL